MAQIDRRTLARYWPIIAGVALLLLAAAAALILTGGGDGSDNEPVAEGDQTPTLTPTLSPSPEAVGTPTLTLTPSLTPTLEPYVHTVQEGETLLFILQLYGYRDQSVIPEVLALNGLASPDGIFADQQLLIPRQTPTPGPTATPTTEGVEAEEESDFAGCSLEDRCISNDGQFWMHEVAPGETIAGLAFAYDTTVSAIQEDNNVAEFIVEGQILRIRILVSPTPTLTPTGGPDSTATPTPTLAPPEALSPANGTEFSRSDAIALQWVAALPLQSGQRYRVELRDPDTSETVFTAFTTATAYRLPDELRPSSGSVTYEWRVTVVGGSEANPRLISGEGRWLSFTWG